MIPETELMMNFIDKVLDHGYFYAEVSDLEIKYNTEDKWTYKRVTSEGTFKPFTTEHLNWLVRKKQFDLHMFDQLLLDSIGSAVALREMQLARAKELLGPQLYDSQLDLWKAFERTLLQTIEDLLGRPTIRKVEDLDDA